MRRKTKRFLSISALVLTLCGWCAFFVLLSWVPHMIHTWADMNRELTGFQFILVNLSQSLQRAYIFYGLVLVGATIGCSFWVTHAMLDLDPAG